MSDCNEKRLKEVEPNTLLVGVDIAKKQHVCVVVHLIANVLTGLKLSSFYQGFERPLEKVDLL